MEMNQMKRKVLSLAMIAALFLTMLPTAGWAADAPVEYIDFDENGVQITEPRSCDQYSLVTENNTEWNASDENNGWYVVSGEVTIGKKEAPQRVTVSGDVHLILANDAKLTVNGGISVNAGNSLTVYAQPAEKDETMGSLIVQNVEQNNAGIGGGSSSSGGTITINGGEITATGGTGGAGIGGGSKINGSGGTITINGGTITTNGGVNSAGIGGGDYGSGGKITINGGAITATGGSNGAGIGGGANGSGDKLTINGGEINATGGPGGAGIGGGYSGSGGTITISGGDAITATGDGGGAGIGSGSQGSGGEITINGGDNIIATGNGGGAGIGGGNSRGNVTIEINGGNITANGQGSSSTTGGAGIGDGYTGSGSTIKIHGGKIVATGYSGSAGIGSGFAAPAGSATVINIDGGIVTATCSDDALETLGGAGIGGGGAANSPVAITISGGTVTATGGKGADGIGNGGGKSSSAQPATFSTGEDGNAVIYATAGEGNDTEAIVGKDDTSNWRGVIFLGNDGKIYGDSVTPNENFSVPESSTLTIESGKTLVVADEITLTNEGTITGSGAIRLYGTLTGKGTIESVQQVHPVRNLSLSETNLNMTVGDEPATLTATVEPTDATNPTVTWSSSNDSVVTVADGKVTAVAAGSATITAISVDDPDIKATCAVTVKEAGNPDPGTDPEEPGTDPDPEPGTDPDDPSTEPDDPAEDEPSDTPSTPVIPSEPDPEIEVTEPAHGDVEISPSKPEAGETVTITPTPDDGYEVEDVIVTDEDGECVPVRENPDGSWSYEQPKSDVTIEVIFGEVAPEPTVDVSEIFLDVDPDAWYKDAVQFAYDNGLMTGTSATEFAPDVTTTRAMIVSILARLEGVTAADDAGFTDVDDEWFATAVNWAANVGVVNGFEDNTFRPNDTITREQLAAILCNYAAWKGEDVSARAELSRYSDAAAISSWATDVMRWAVAENLISGVTTDELQPQGAATRVQVAAILQRFLSK